MHIEEIGIEYSINIANKIGWPNTPKPDWSAVFDSMTEAGVGHTHWQSVKAPNTQKYEFYPS